MKKKRQVTLLVIPGDSGRSIRKKVSYSTIYTVLTVAVLLFATFAFMAINYSRVYYKALRAEILERRNLKLEEQWRKITHIEKDLAQLKRTDQKIRKMLGVERAPSPPELGSPEIAALSEKLETSFGGAVTVKTEGEASESTAILLEEIPTLWPTRGWLTRPFSADHSGIDIAAPTGAPIVATTSGVVTRSGWDDIYGQIIKITTDRGFVTVYGHNSRLLVKEGDRVRRGDVIAFVGSTGLSSAPHLHFETHLKGKPVDPMGYLVH